MKGRERFLRNTPRPCGRRILGCFCGSREDVWEESERREKGRLKTEGDGGGGVARRCLETSNTHPSKRPGVPSNTEGEGCHIVRIFSESPDFHYLFRFSGLPHKFNVNVVLILTNTHFTGITENRNWNICNEVIYIKKINVIFGSFFSSLFTILICLVPKERKKERRLELDGVS